MEECKDNLKLFLKSWSYFRYPTLSRRVDSNVAQVFVGTGNVEPERDEDCMSVRADNLRAWQFRDEAELKRNTKGWSNLLFGGWLDFFDSKLNIRWLGP